jgi:hypothetical protein
LSAQATGADRSHRLSTASTADATLLTNDDTYDLVISVAAERPDAFDAILQTATRPKR